MNPAIGRYRWTICALIFFATTINYLDRAVISLLKSTLEKEFNWSESDYSNIVIAFQLCYALGMLAAGRLMDTLGTKKGYALAILTWSIAAIAHALATSTGGFLLARGFLGVTEAGNFPAAIKTVAEWFPKKERALATGIFNSGANVGAIVAPLTVPLIAEKLGWQWAFIITGSVGVVWLLFWYYLYEVPSRQNKLSKAEYDYIHSDDEKSVLTVVGKTDDKQITSWRKLLSYRHTWAFIIGKFLTDPVWWFYLFWLPAFLKAEYNITGTAIIFPVALVYTISSLGSIYGGWLPLTMIKKGWAVTRSRKTAMFIYALCAMPVVFAQLLGQYNMWLAVGLIGFAAAAHQAWSANIFTTVSDRFPKNAVGTVIGIGGMAGALGGILVSKSAGLLFDHYKDIGQLQTGYYIMFFICGFAYLTAWLVMVYLNKSR
jgi:MFS transporter, ACS family, hexuronate transporter